MTIIIFIQFHALLYPIIPQSKLTPYRLLSLLLRLNLVPDLLIRGSRKNLLLHQLIVPLVWSVLDEFLRVDLANTEDNGPTKRGGNNESHGGKQKVSSDKRAESGQDDASLQLSL